MPLLCRLCSIAWQTNTYLSLCKKMHLYCRKGEAYSKRIIYTRNDNMIGHIYLELSNTVFVSFYQYRFYSFKKFVTFLFSWFFMMSCCHIIQRSFPPCIRTFLKEEVYIFNQTKFQFSTSLENHVMYFKIAIPKEKRPNFTILFWNNNILNCTQRMS